MIRLGCCIIAASSLTAAQGPAPRLALFGKVLDASGRPAAKAEVIAHARPRHPAMTPTRLLETTTDARGRFRLLVAARTEHVVYARNTQGTEITQAATAFAGKPITLTTRARRGPKSLAIAGTGAWKRPLRLFLVDTAGARYELEATDPRRVPLPTIPGDTAALEAWDPTSRLHEWTIDLRSATPPQLALPAPMRVRVRVFDAESKKPIAGARIFGRGRHRTWTPGEHVVATDADGVAQLDCPQPAEADGTWANWHTVLFRVIAPGYALGVTGWSSNGEVGTEPLDRDRLRDGAAPQLELGLEPGHRIRGRVLAPGGKPASGQTLLVRRKTACGGPGGLQEVIETVEILPTDRQGAFRIDGILPAQNTAIEMSLVLPGRHPRLLALPRVCPKESVELKPIQLDRLCVTPVVARLPNGEPARFATVHQLGWSQRLYRHHGREFSLRPRLQCDRLGRCELWTAQPGKLHIAIEGDGHYALREIDTGAKGTLPVPLVPLATVRGRVRNSKGKLIAGARVCQEQSSARPGGVLENWAVWRNQSLLFATTGRDGTFEMRFIPQSIATFRVCAFTPSPPYVKSNWIDIARESSTDVLFEFPAGK